MGRSSTSPSTPPTASRSRSTSRRITRTRSSASLGIRQLAGLDDGRRPGRLPGLGRGRGPFIFSIGAFEDDGTPKYQTETDFGETNGDIPTSELDFAWTNYGVGNVNTNEVSDIITGGLDIERTMEYGQYIGQDNNGNHTQLFQDVDDYLRGLDLPVAVVDNDGNFMGWAMFHVTSASAGSDKHVRGYFLSSFITARLRVTSCASRRLPSLPRDVRPQAVRLSPGASAPPPSSSAVKAASTRARVAAGSAFVSMTVVAEARSRSARSPWAGDAGLGVVTGHPPADQALDLAGTVAGPRARRRHTARPARPRRA